MYLGEVTNVGIDENKKMGLKRANDDIGVIRNARNMRNNDTSSRILAGSFLLLDNDAARTFASTGVSFGSLAANREAASVAETAIGAEVHEAFDVHAHDAAQVAFDLVLGVDNLADAAGFNFGEVVGTDVTFNIRFLEDFKRAGSSNTVNIGEGDVHAFATWEVDASNTSHDSYP